MVRVLMVRVLMVRVLIVRVLIFRVLLVSNVCRPVVVLAERGGKRRRSVSKSSLSCCSGETVTQSFHDAVGR